MGRGHNFIVKKRTPDESLDGIFNTALEIAQKRRETLNRLRAALKAKNVAEVCAVAEELCGLSYDEESDRTN